MGEQAQPRVDDYDTPRAVRLAMARMDLTATDLSALLRYWGDRRLPQTIYRGVTKLTERTRATKTPWMLRALLMLMERTPSAWQRDLPAAIAEWSTTDGGDAVEEEEDT